MLDDFSFNRDGTLMGEISAFLAHEPYILRGGAIGTPKDADDPGKYKING